MGGQNKTEFSVGVRKVEKRKKKKRKLDCSYLPAWDCENAAIIS